MANLYPKKFEDVFSVDYEGNSAKLDLDCVTIEGMALDEYIKVFGHFLRLFYNDLFNGCVRLSWLRRKFGYDGRPTKLPMNTNSRRLNGAFVKLLRRNIGHDIQIMTRGKFFSKLELYFDELFPGFMDGNPFEDPRSYAFPFKFITLEYLIVVHDMDERMDLLREADKREMKFSKFQDYVINHSYSVNAALGRTKYIVKQNIDRNFPFSVRNADKLKSK